MKLTIFSELRSFLNSDSTIFLLEILKKKKKLCMIYVFSGLADAFFEFVTISMLYFIITIITTDNFADLSFDKFIFINNFSFLVNYISSLDFRSVFVFTIIFTLLIQITQVFFKYLNSVCAGYIEASYAAIMTKNIYSHIFNLSYKYSSQYKMGDLADYINNSPVAVKAYIYNLNQMLVSIVIALVYIIFLIKVSFWNSIVTIIIFLISNKIRKIILPKIDILSAKAVKNTVYLSESIIEKFQALRLIYSNGLNDFVIKEINEKNNILEHSLKKISAKLYLLPTLVSLSPILLLALLSIIYCFFSNKSELISTLGILLISLQRIVTRFTSITYSLSKISEAKPKLKRLISLFKGKDFQLRRLGGKIINLPVKEITFSRINFKYSNSSKFSLKDINFNLRIREITAIVGLSGSGKSSILDLLVGLFEPNNGDILIDGNKIKDINLDNWQKEISIVSQDSFLLNDSIINNIKFGLENVSFKEIKKACIDSGSHEFIENLPDSYNTIIGERGFKLSGGERQRISIARAFLKKSSLLILDEATSALDSKTEEFIKQNIFNDKANKITLIVAHRLSTIKESDNILVMNKGRIVESGNHEFLIQQKKIYAKLWDIQTRASS